MADAEGEARLWMARESVAAAQAHRVPPYRGPLTAEAISPFISREVASWYKEHLLILRQAVHALQAVHRIRPSPPPRWTLAAASRMARLFEQFRSDIDSLPVPRAWEKDNEIDCLRAFCGYDDSLEPFVRGARRACEIVIEIDSRHRISGADVEWCEDWLAGIYKAEFHGMDELRPSATLSPSFWDEPAIWTPVDLPSDSTHRQSESEQR